MEANPVHLAAAACGGALLAFGIMHLTKEQPPAPVKEPTKQPPDATTSKKTSTKAPDVPKEEQHAPPITQAAHGFVVPAKTPAYVKQGHIKDSLAYVSTVATALAGMPRKLSACPFMDMAVEEACTGVVTREGGPFGAVITREVDDPTAPNGKVEEVVARAHNMVLQTNDPTAHAEVTCIRKACARLGKYDLSECKMYSSCEPCPMCFGAIHWAKIEVCKYAATKDDAEQAGFSDAFIYAAIRGTADEVNCEFIHEEHDGAVAVFKRDEYDLY